MQADTKKTGISKNMTNITHKPENEWHNAMVTCEIYLFQNYFSWSLQLMNMLNIAEIL